MIPGTKAGCKFKRKRAGRSGGGVSLVASSLLLLLFVPVSVLVDLCQKFEIQLAFVYFLAFEKTSRIYV